MIARAAEAGFDIGPGLLKYELPGVSRPEELCLFAVTEQRTRAQIDAVVEAMAG